MGKKILMQQGAIKKLMKDFDVSYPTVWKALNYITRSTLSNLIRASAIERGGLIVTKPDLKTN